MALSRTKSVVATSLFAALPFLAASLGTAAFLAAPGARAAGSYDSDDSRPERRRGPYVAVGGGGILQIVPGAIGRETDTFGYDLEARLGASLSPRTQLYLSANYDTASHGALIGSVRWFNSNFMVNLNHALYAERDFAVYLRIGLGLGLTGGNNGLPTEKGLGDVFAIGFDGHLNDQASLAPEVFYRRSNESSNSRIDSVGLQLNLVYY